ncbi:sugar ABC transporter permease [Exiguobacterium sp. SH1S21]|uniref:carbohydrate ABC transporter permease n=1 Tax=Exiguobacterium sp. SH1S21 TaxID=2510953 RepID=UPI00103AF138|nr:sugar ABC transporter permease [Exiguobacterium sp. SH1S21]TCI57534.1 sugar ABC transporter permease [Exiguobacterium sp. SH1S21]
MTVALPKQRVRAHLSDAAAGVLYLSPSIALFGIFLVYPLFRTIYLSFFRTDTQGTPLSFVGGEHYAKLFTSASFWQSIQATVGFVLLTVPLTIIIALGLALLANEKLRGIGFFRTAFSATMGMSVAASSVIWMFMYNPSIGIFNRFLEAVGASGVQWLLDPQYALLSVSLATVWMNIGFTFLIILGGLQNIDRTLYESADIAGTSYGTQLRSITIPMLSPTLFFVGIISLINAFQTFGQIDLLTKGGPTNSTNVIVYAIYKDAFINYNVGGASAQAVLLFVTVLLLTWLQFKLVERKVHYQ